MLRRNFLGGLAATALTTLPSLAQTQKLLIVHADDAGMCHSANVATIEAMERGLVSSASVMMPCPWVTEFCEWAKANPKYDLGVHLTLTSEWKHFRWRPLTMAKGLLDAEQYLWRDVRSTARNASAAEVEAELRAQVERAKLYGLAFTHLDTHMGTLYARPDYFDVYGKLALENKVPCMLPDPNGVPEAEMRAYPITATMLEAKRAQGHRLLDRLVTGVPGRNYAERRESYRKFIQDLKPGVTKLIIHLAKDDAEIRAISGAWEYRWADYQFWTSNEAEDLLGQSSVKLFTYREFAAG